MRSPMGNQLHSSIRWRYHSGIKKVQEALDLPIWNEFQEIPGGDNLCKKKEKRMYAHTDKPAEGRRQVGKAEPGPPCGGGCYPEQDRSLDWWREEVGKAPGWINRALLQVFREPR